MNGEETTTHMLLQCTFARSVWNSISQEVAQELANVQDIQQWVKSWSDTNSRINFRKQSTINLIVITLWFIWKARCELVFDNKRSSTNSLTNKIRDYCRENKIQTNNNLNQVQVLCNNHNRTARSRTNITSWNPPQRGWLKVNIDAYVLPDSNIAGIALIIRDVAGQFVEAWTMVERVRDITQAEAVAALKALQWIYQLQLKNVIVEGDNKTFMDNINGLCNISPWEDGNIIRECQHLVLCLGSVVVCFRNRKGNQVADLLAKFARSNLCSRKWCVNLLVCVSSKMESEKISCTV
ncbi:uncharacterized protein LOC113272379 [Papaver somniferum]|uniref:uncharacterized protein LOC113272379 n=1 Tax=Papaver somniferum TaxID=3469 RepID=UPI000E6F9F79|nr:uncharacterized protein LOC113272379 [Papaver somniferum]